MTEQVERLYADFMFSWDKKDKSRLFLPFLGQEGPARDWLLEKVEQRPFILIDFDFSLAEWSLLDLEKYDDLFERAIKNDKLELAYVVGKATGKYNICCLFNGDVSPLSVLQVLQDHLPGHELATAYIPYTNLEDMLYYGLIPCPYITELREDYLQVLELKQAGLSEAEIKHWLEVDNSEDYLNKVGFWSLLTKEQYIWCEIPNILRCIVSNLKLYTVRPERRQSRQLLSVIIYLSGIALQKYAS